jgi:hypothetical protein
MDGMTVIMVGIGISWIRVGEITNSGSLICQAVLDLGGMTVERKSCEILNDAVDNQLEVSTFVTLHQLEILPMIHNGLNEHGNLFILGEFAS